MGNIKKENFFKSLIILVIPLIIQGFLRNSINLVDTIMVGKFSEIELATVSLCNQPFFLFSVLIFGFVSGGTVLVAQYYGKGDYSSVNNISSMIILISLFIISIFTFFLAVFPENIINMYTKDPFILNQSLDYFKFAKFNFLFYGLGNVITLILRSIKVVYFTTLLDIISFILKIFLNHCFMYGILGFSKLGVKGVALATLLVNILKIILLFLYIKFYGKVIKFKIRFRFKFYKENLKKIFKYGTPVLLKDFTWSLGITLFTSIVGTFGARALAANSVFSFIETIINIPIIAVSGVANIMTGYELGANNIKKIKKTTSIFWIISACIGILLGMFILIFKAKILSFYNIDIYTNQLTADLLTILSVFLVFNHVSLIFTQGIFRGSGDTKFCMYMSVFSLWFLSIPFVLFFKYMNFSLPYIYICLYSYTIFNSVCCLFRLKSNKWVVNVTHK